VVEAEVGVTGWDCSCGKGQWLGGVGQLQNEAALRIMSLQEIKIPFRLYPGLPQIPAGQGRAAEQGSGGSTLLTEWGAGHLRLGVWFLGLGLE
jgi:hypothetical protein